MTLPGTAGSPLLKVLAVDDEPDVVWLLEQTLTREGYEVKGALNGSEGLRLAYTFRPDLILLDIMMPGMNGWEVLRRLREFTDVPVVMLTVVSSEDSVVQALETGADDYITKPFAIKELKARIRAATRRAGLPPSDGVRVLTFDDGQLAIDPAIKQVRVRGRVVNLSPTEYKLLLYLAVNAGQVLTHAQLLDNVWGPGYEDSHLSVKVYVWRLRTKLEADPSHPRYILTKRGTGYYLAKI